MRKRGDAPEPQDPDWRNAEAQPLWKRLAWMAAIWAASVMALGAVALVIRTWLNP